MTERFSISRSLVTGALLSALVPVMAHLSSDLVHASYMAIDFMPVAPIFLLLFVVLIVNTALRALCPSAALTRPELLVVYTMMIMSASITSMGLGSQLLPVTAAPLHYATTENRWAELIQPHFPAWLAPAPDAVGAFFVGLDAGEGIPWGAWVRPLAGWLCFLGPGYFVMIATMVILRKQWVDHEHLIFPLTVLPAAMTESPAEGRLFGPFFRSPGMWIGFAAVFAIASANALHSYWDAVPTIALNHQLPLFRNTVSLAFRISFPVLGFAFLINKDLAFSLWAFNLLFLVIRGNLNIMGIRLDENLGTYNTSPPSFAYLGLGAIVAVVFTGLYQAREHLKGVFRRACGRSGGIDDSDEIISYRVAVWGSVLCLAVMWAWLWRAGLPLLIAPFYLLVAYVLFLGLTRVVSEGGLPTIRLTMIAPAVVFSFLGVRTVGSAGLVALALMYVWCADPRIFPMAECAQGLKLVEDVPATRRRSVGWGMGLALAISFVLSIGISLYLAYTYGGMTLNRWFFEGAAKAPYGTIAEKIQHPSSPSVAGFVLVGLGALAATGLAVLRSMYPWFGLHPIGLAVGPMWLMSALWFSIFLAWLIKSIGLRYGGPHFYRKAVPVFMGLVLGQYTAAAFWFLVDLCTGKSGNRLFWI